MASSGTLLRLALVLVCIVSIGLAAATIAAPLDPGSDGHGPGDGEGSDPITPQTGEGATGEVPTFLQYLLFVVIVLTAVLFAWYMINYRREVVVIAAVLIGVALVFVLLYAVLVELGLVPELQGELPMEGDEQPDEDYGEPGGGDGEGTEETSSWDLAPFVGVLAVLSLIFVGALAMAARSDDDETSGLAAEPDESTDERAAVAAAAGRAADRITETATQHVDNEVYRAWDEMTRLLEVDNPDATTPGEFADAAIDAGLDAQHVEALTALFEDVRYGHRDSTAEREQRAIETLRAIEAEAGHESGLETDPVQSEESAAQPNHGDEDETGDDTDGGTS